MERSTIRFHPRPVIFGGFVTFSTASTPRIDPEFSEDEFDHLFRDEVVPDAILRAADLLETEVLGICHCDIIHCTEESRVHLRRDVDAIFAIKAPDQPIQTEKFTRASMSGLAEKVRKPRQAPAEPYRRGPRPPKKDKDAPRTSAKPTQDTRQQNLTLADWLRVYAYVDEHPRMTQQAVVNYFKTLHKNFNIKLTVVAQSTTATNGLGTKLV
ncbi:hypothetical protein B0H14DRAFT_2639554 [Mycena olivaceomarginata]|nr:hypothetical protein B0H14DRAFT_2639554 [Mycena olivaceomarginata]